MEDRVAPQDSACQSMGVKCPEAPRYTNTGKQWGCDHDRLCSPKKETETKRDGRVLCEEDRQKKGRKKAASVAQQMMTFLGNIPYM